MFAAATDWLEKSVPDIDALNVFPVPDGDCGTNMLLTMRSSLEEASRTTDQKVSAVVQAMAKGALMGARGNSGVILSQIWRGLAKSWGGKETIDDDDLAAALLKASETAYTGLSNPVEGTILTVIRDAASAARKQATNGNCDVISVLEATVNAAKASVANTPNLLEVLREAGVVDAGGQGLYTLLEGAFLYLKGDTDLMQSRKSEIITSSVPLTARPFQMTTKEEIPYGYCTEFLLTGEDLDPDKIREKLKNQGQSLIVVGDESSVRIHIHVLDPSRVIRHAVSLGTMHDISIRNMDDQHKEFLKKQKEKTVPPANMAVLAVVSGDGLAKVFTSLGAAVIPGGMTMNPSTKDIWQAVEAVKSDKIIVLPNNKNVIPVAQQVRALTTKQVKVVPTETIPQGIAALMAFDPQADFDHITKLMTQERAMVKTIEITSASRATKLNGLDIKKGQSIGLLDGKLLAANEGTDEVVTELLGKIDLDEAEVITLYYGANITEAETQHLRTVIRQQYPSLEIEIVYGGQPHYHYIISVE